MFNLDWFVDSLIRYRFFLLMVCLVTVAAAILPAQNLTFDRSIETLFRKDDPRYQNYRLDKQLFGGIETAIFAYDDVELFSLDGLERLQSTSNRLSQVEGVRKALSLNDVRRPTAVLDRRKLFEQVKQAAVNGSELKSEILQTDLYRDRLVSANGKTALILLELEPAKEDPGRRARTIEELKEIAGAHPGPAVVLGGPVLVEEIFSSLEKDGILLGFASSLILLLVIAVLFRSIRWTVLPLAVVHVSLIWTKALISLLGLRLTMVSAQLVAMVTVIGVATSVHVMVRFREERASFSVDDALRRTLLHVIPAIFWTCVTTAAGFLALYASSIAPFQNFAIMMSLGSMMVFFSTIMLVPGAALMFPGFESRMGQLPGEQSMTRSLTGLARSLRKYPLRVTCFAIVLLLICSIGTFRLGVATDFTSNFRQSSSIVQSFHFLRERLESLETLDVLVEVPDLKTPEFDDAISRIRLAQQELEKDPKVVDSLSVVDLLDFLNRVIENMEDNERAGWPAWLPATDSVSDRGKLFLLQALEPGLVNGLLNREQNVARIMVQIRPVPGSQAKSELIQRVEQTFSKSFESAKAAGFFVLLSSVVNSLLADQWVTFALSVISIFLIMAIAFRNMGLALIAMVPNAAPIFIVLGTMGWLGWDINMATAMMASISMGLSVDFSIHYLYRFRQEIRQGRHFFEALREAHSSVGLAMLVANLALIAGFLSLTLSSLIPSVHFGLMVSVTMIGGLLGNLVVLPLLLRLLWLLKWVKDASETPSESDSGS